MEDITSRVNESLNHRENVSVRRVADGVRRLNSQKTQLVTLLSEKDERLKHALNRWVDFQKLYTELKNINDWFESREETLSRFQRIVTQREFEIALEDVKVGSPVSTYKFSKLISIHFLIDLVKRICSKIKEFSLG